MFLVTIGAAWACKVACESPLGEEGLVQPANGALGVPVDALPVVFSSETVRLVDDYGNEVASSARPPGPSEARLVRFTLESDLEPYTRYEILEDLGGERRSLGSFTTSATRAARELPPAPSSLAAAGRIDRDLWPGYGLRCSCGGYGEVVAIDASWAETTGVYEIRASAPSGAVFVYLVGAETLSLGWDVPCLETIPKLSPRDLLTIEVRSVDLLGRPGPWSDPLRASAAQVESRAAIAR